MRTEDEILADAVKQQPFSNSTSFEIWANSGRGCYDCRHDKPDIEKYCPILSAAYLGFIPKEWTDQGLQDYDCSEFEYDDEDGDDDPEPEPVPQPVAEMDGQTDMFEVFAEHITETVAKREAVSA